MGVVKFTTRFIALPVLAMTFLVSAVGTLSASGVRESTNVPTNGVTIVAAVSTASSPYPATRTSAVRVVKRRHTELACALGRVQLGRIEEIIALRRCAAERYDSLLGSIPSLIRPMSQTSSWRDQLVCLRRSVART